MGWEDYWREVCAPKLKARKDELGRAMPEREIAAYVETNSGKRSTRALVSLWLLGEREPYISQFFSLCRKLDVDPYKILNGNPEPPKPVSERTVLRRTGRARTTAKRLRNLKSSK